MDWKTGNEEFSVDLGEEIEAWISYGTGPNVTRRQVCIEAMIWIAGAGYGVRAFCRLHDEARNFLLRGVKEIEVLRPAHLAHVTTLGGLESALGDEIAQIDEMMVEGDLGRIDEDPRLVLLAAAGQSLLIDAAEEDWIPLKDKAQARIEAFMARAVRWIEEDDRDLLAFKMLDSLELSEERISRAMTKVFANSRDEIFFEVSGVVLLNPGPAGMALLKTMHEAYDKVAGERPPPWCR